MPKRLQRSRRDMERAEHQQPISGLGIGQGRGQSRLYLGEAVSIRGHRGLQAGRKRVHVHAARSGLAQAGQVPRIHAR